MALGGDDRGDSQAPRDQLDDARKRRQRRATPRNPTRRAKPRGSGERPPAADARRHALDIANSVRSRDSELGLPTTSASADEILAQHQAGELAPPPDPPPSTSRADAPAADAILLALQEHDQRAQPSGAPAAPRGSAELEKDQPRATRRPRSTPRRRRGEQKLFSARRTLAGVGVIVIAVAMIASAGTGSSSRKTAPSPWFDSAASKPATGLIEAVNLTLGALARNAHAVGKLPDHARSASRRSRRRTHVGARHRSSARTSHVASATPPPTPVTPARVTPTQVSNGDQTAATTSGSTSPSGSSYSQQQPAASEPHVTQPASSTQTATQPAGPSGPGGTVGTNCNPKCQ